MTNSNQLLDDIKNNVVILDGAMGTELFASGVDMAGCNEYLCVSDEAIVTAIHKNYVDCGSDAVLTNTFGANKFALARHGHDEDVTQINIAAAELARKSGSKYVLGDIGPTGDFLQPLGSLDPKETKAAFREQASALETGGVDGFIIETMTALDEVVVAVEAVKSVSNLPLFVSMAFDSAPDGFRTMMGVDVASSVVALAQYDLDAMGFNCGKIALADYIELARSYADAVSAAGISPALFAEINAGLPELIDGQAAYNVGSAELADTAVAIFDAGYRLIGGCCGTTPKHIEALAQAVKK